MHMMSQTIQFKPFDCDWFDVFIFTSINAT